MRIPTPHIGTSLIVLGALISAQAHATGIIGTRTNITSIAPCKTTYVCTMKAAGTSGPYTKSTLSLRIRHPSERTNGWTWELNAFTKAGVNVGLNWHVEYQDDFYPPESEALILSVASAYLGQNVPKEAMARIVRNATGEDANPKNSTVRSAQFVIDSVSRAVANAGSLDVYFTSIKEHDALRAVEPRRITMTDAEKRRYIEKIRTTVNAFEGDSALCKNSPKFAVLYPGGGSVTWESLNTVMERLGFINSGGARYIKKYPGSTFFLLEQGKDFCITAN